MKPFLSRLDLQTFRNYHAVSFRPDAQVTLVVGPNGAGKTSLVEALYVLATGRSFRTGRLEKVVENGADRAVLYAEVRDGDRPESAMRRVGMARSRQKLEELKVDGERVRGLAEVARLLPVLVMHPGTVDLVEGGSGGRRRPLDWILFHVEHDFQGQWQAFSSALRQRNNLLKSGKVTPAELRVWDRQLAQSSVRIDGLRRQVFPAFQDAFQNHLARLSPELDGVRMSLHPGWELGADLAQALTERHGLDVRRGFTSVGAHRADVRLASDAGSVREVFSRGQKKVVAYALVLAQLSVFKALNSQTCIVLVDDLTSELDEAHCQRVLAGLLDTGSQVIITALNQGLPPGVADSGARVSMFHVEHGQLKRLD
ncbi:MAG: DNA replication/repair protein RecF [Alcanivoracaceae bacterium]